MIYKQIWFLVFLILLVPVFSEYGYSKEVTIDVTLERTLQANDCLKCHDSIDSIKFANSVHGFNACTSCHSDIIDIEKHSEGIHLPKKVNCSICHEKEAGEYITNVHKVAMGFSCDECHSEPHYLKSWKGDKREIIKKCTSCHEEESYVVSGHARAIMKGNNDSAVCSDCHGLHDTKVLHTTGRTYPVKAREFYTRACNRCHSDVELMEKNNLTTIAVKTYHESIHGKIQKLGYAAAGCADCHTSHNILPKDDPLSTVNEKNLITVCSRCHDHVNENFVKFISHAHFTDRTKFPLLFWTVVFMTTLLVVTLLFFWFHTLLWWRKAYWEKQKLLAEGHLITDKLAHIENPGDTYKRFKLRDRILHLILMLTFFGLACTGLPLRFPDAVWSKFMLDFISGVSVALFLHRICAFILIIEFLIVIGYSFHFTFFNKKAGNNWKERLFGSDSLLFTKKDFKDFVGMMNWFVDQGPPPQFDRWTYWEKFDFMAVFWGMCAIGISGVLMWWPEITSYVFPGWIFNLARIIHADEALLAIGFIFTVHFFNTHFIPTKWPMNYSIFTGRIYKWEFIEEIFCFCAF